MKIKVLCEIESSNENSQIRTKKELVDHFVSSINFQHGTVDVIYPTRSSFKQKRKYY